MKPPAAPPVAASHVAALPCPPARRGLLLAAIAVASLAGGCARLQHVGIVDQRTFDPRAGLPPQPHLPPAPPARPGPGPLITIAAGTPEDQWRAPLKQAVRAALARKPNVLFELRQVVPAAGSVEATAQGGEAAAHALLGPLAQAIVDDGAAIAQVQLGAASEPMAPGGKGAVRIYLH